MINQKLCNFWQNFDIFEEILADFFGKLIEEEM